MRELFVKIVNDFSNIKLDIDLWQGSKYAFDTRKKSCPSKFCNIHRKPPVLASNNFNTGIFLWILRNFQQQLIWRTSSKGCFCSEFHWSLMYDFTFTDTLRSWNFSKVHCKEASSHFAFQNFVIAIVLCRGKIL